MNLLVANYVLVIRPLYHSEFIIAKPRSSSLVDCTLCFTLIRFLILTDVSPRNCTPSIKCLVYALRQDTIYASVRVIFFDVVSHVCGTLSSCKHNRLLSYRTAAMIEPRRAEQCVPVEQNNVSPQSRTMYPRRAEQCIPCCANVTCVTSTRINT